MPDRADTGIKEIRHRGDEPHLLREVVRTYQALMAGMSRRTGMPASHFVLMRLLAVADSDPGIMELARQLGVDAAAVTRQVQALERGGLVRRRADPKDGRRSYVCLSAKGRKLFGTIHEGTHAFERLLSSAIGADEMAVATKVLVKLRGFVQGQK